MPHPPTPVPHVAVILPCLNEAAAVGHVIDDVLAALPEATVYVYDNRSTDDTAEVARAHGALVRYEPRPGKGNVIRRAFADVEADVYVLLDGDDTYDASVAGELVQKLITEGLDHVVGARRASTVTAYRRGHAAGNKMLNQVVSTVFGEPVTDMLSGYRVMSRRFVKSFPAISRGFEVETELTVHAVNLRVPQAEVPSASRTARRGRRASCAPTATGGRSCGGSSGSPGTSGRRSSTPCSAGSSRSSPSSWASRWSSSSCRRGWSRASRRPSSPRRS